MLNTKFSPWPVFEADERDAAMKPLFSGKVNYWTGQEGREFEKEYAAYTGRSHAIALANGSLAIELALCALNIGPGDEVITTARTFIASASSVVMRGAVPVIADVDPVSQVITAETIRAVLTPRTKAIICVHLAGWPCDMDSIMELAREKGIYVIEDCAQAHGARYKGKPVGSFGDLAAFSFCQDKILSTGGEGGMLMMDDEKLWKKAWAFKDHGKSWDAVYERDHAPGFRWLHESFGTNWRMTEMQAAIGRVQLRKLDGWVAKRRANAAKLTECFTNLPGLRVTLPGDEIFHSYYKYYVFVRPDMLKEGWDRDRIMNEVMNMGVPCFSGSCSEIYREKAFTDAGYGPVGRLPVAKELGETSLMFLVHPTLKEDEVGKACEIVEDIMKLATV
ncbi:DegT/DnrJ/EryC1/StrS aminotransferase family protein [Desulforhopalus vacuolatus]|uniref:DegT/DnrJ/EryC1/StrS family aminotransferase n=1 Tax=Desulforhopalus vacuolatus TaxID=40414 RepID=UPI001965DCD2|nr:DegT/DnrJ/EryC1/StrS aminotransferase family protein [Desulforhopalus vacuolatus]MBM9520881.1 DegT/DnrJ/EryC1/StrS aminotransferase family protein [Desulforhopalus vacuolatus]